MAIPKDKTVETRVGQAIRRLRKQKGLTLAELGALVNLSPSHLSQIERGVGTPSLSALKAIADAVGARLSDLILESDSERKSPVNFLSRQADRSPARYPGTDITVELIRYAESSVQLLWVTAPPGEGVSTHWRASAGEEHAFVESGQMRIELNGDEFVLGPGDAIVIHAFTPHQWENAGSDELRVLWAITPPGF